MPEHSPQEVGGGPGHLSLPLRVGGSAPIEVGGSETRLQSRCAIGPPGRQAFEVLEIDDGLGCRTPGLYVKVEEGEAAKRPL